MDFDCAKEKDERNCCYIIWSNIRKNFCNSIYIKEYDKNLWSYYIYIFAILLHIYIFVNTLLFSVNNFNAYKNIGSFQFLVTKQYDKFINTYIICFLVIKIFQWIFNKIYESSTRCWYIKNLLIFILVFMVNIAFTYYIIIFSIINSYTFVILYASMAIYIPIYFIIYSIICSIISIIRYCSLKVNCKCLFDCSNCLKQLLFD
jgi:hypothetical protein